MNLDDAKKPTWQEDLINWYMDFAGVLVSQEDYIARVETCKGCDKFGVVVLPGGTEVPGCTICKCPVETKPRVLKYFNPAKMRVVKVKCPLGKWAVL